MKKVVLASLLACAAIAVGLPSAYSQQAVSLGSAPAGQVQMSDAEYTAYNNAMSQTDPKAKAAAIEAYLTAFPQSAVKLDTLVALLQTYSQVDPQKTIDTADRILQLDPSNLRALTFEVYFRVQLAGAPAMTDAAAKQTAFDSAAGFAQTGLTSTKPAAMADADFKTLQTAAFPVFYGAIGYDALLKKDSATAIDAYKKELAFVPIAQTQTPGPVLQDTFYLGEAYYQSTPPDYLNCAFYASRAVAYAPDQFKAQMAPTAKYCYTKYHGNADGYDAVVAAATANLNPPAGLFDSIKPAPTPADIVANVISTTPDLAVLAVGDKEFILQNGTPEQAAKVWDTIKGKSVEIPGALVISSTPTQLQVAVSDDAVQSKTADFTFNMTPPEDASEPKAGATPAQKLAAKKAADAAKKDADAIAAAIAVGQTVTLDGTYDSFTPKPIMITMSSGSVVLPKAAAAKKTAAAPVHHAVAKKK